MKRPVLGVLTLSTLLGLGVLTSCEDEFSEQDIMQKQEELLAKQQEGEIALEKLTHEQNLAYQKAQDSLERVGGVVVYSVRVLDASKVNTTSARTKIAKGATVKVVQNGVAISVIADEDGLAVFDDMRIGRVNVTVSSDNHTTAIYTADITPDYGSINVPRNASTTVPIFPTTVEAGAGKVTGKVQAETNLLNDQPEAAVGAKITASIALNSYTFRNNFLVDGGTSQAGRIESISYANATVSTTVGEDGTYELIVPAGIGNGNEGLPITLSFANYSAQQILIQNNAIDTVSALFAPGETASAIPSDAGISIKLPEFAKAGNGAAFKSSPVATSLIDGTNFDVEVLNGGSGYVGVGGEVKFAIEGADNTFARFQVENGKVSRFIGISGSDEFSSTPKLGSLRDFDATTENDTKGAGATFKVKFMPDYALSMDNGGTGYSFLPTIRVKYTQYNNMSSNSSDFSVSTEYDEIDLATYNGIELVDGTIYFVNGFDFPGQGRHVSYEVVEVKTKERVPAVLTPNFDEGKINFVGITNRGQGYAPNQTINLEVTSLNSKGSGAELIAYTDGSGKIIRVDVVKGGSEYSTIANTASLSSVGDKSNYVTVNAGNETVFNFSYGTGIRE